MVIGAPTCDEVRSDGDDEHPTIATSDSKGFGFLERASGLIIQRRSQADGRCEQPQPD